MSSIPCLFDGCENGNYRAGYCSGHYQQRLAKKALTPLIRRLPMGATAEQRLSFRTSKTDTCWKWTGAKNEKGYGIVWDGKKNVKSHRLAYSLWVEEIPDGAEVDHRCLNRSCVRPEHLRAVTRKQNLENRDGAMSKNGTGVRGVSWDRSRGKFIASVGHRGKQYNLGRFDALADAASAVRLKRLELFTHNELDLRHKAGQDKVS